MVGKFETKCEKCGNYKVEIMATSVDYVNAVRVKFVCIHCNYEAEVPITQVNHFDFRKDLNKVEFDVSGNVWIDGELYTKVKAKQVK